MFTNQQCRIVDGWIRFPRKASLPPVKTRVSIFQQVRVVPKEFYYVVEIIYSVEPADLRLDKRRALGIDLGVANLITAVNNIGVPPFAVKGGAAKSINQFFNKGIARFRSIAARANGILTTRRINRLSKVRANKLGDIFPKTSRAVMDFCVRHDIGTTAIGYNPRWKQGCHLGERTNQNFVQLPLLVLVRQVQYKAALAGITVVLVDERYTSRCSFVDGESVGRQARYAGQRVRRGLFRSRGGRIINADVNAAYNILQKAFPEAFADGIAGVGLHPVLLGLT